MKRTLRSEGVNRPFARSGPKRSFADEAWSRFDRELVSRPSTRNAELKLYAEQMSNSCSSATRTIDDADGAMSLVEQSICNNNAVLHHVESLYEALENDSEAFLRVAERKIDAIAAEKIRRTEAYESRARERLAQEKEQHSQAGLALRAGTQNMALRLQSLIEAQNRSVLNLNQSLPTAIALTTDYNRRRATVFNEADQLEKEASEYQPMLEKDERIVSNEEEKTAKMTETIDEYIERRLSLQNMLHDERLCAERDAQNLVELQTALNEILQQEDELGLEVRAAEDTVVESQAALDAFIEGNLSASPGMVEVEEDESAAAREAQELNLKKEIVQNALVAATANNGNDPHDNNYYIETINNIEEEIVNTLADLDKLVKVCVQLEAQATSLQNDRLNPLNEEIAKCEGEVEEENKTMVDEQSETKRLELMAQMQQYSERKLSLRHLASSCNYAAPDARQFAESQVLKVNNQKREPDSDFPSAVAAVDSKWKRDDGLGWLNSLERFSPSPNKHMMNDVAGIEYMATPKEEKSPPEDFQLTPNNFESFKSTPFEKKCCPRAPQNFDSPLSDEMDESEMSGMEEVDQSEWSMGL